MSDNEDKCLGTLLGNTRVIAAGTDTARDLISKPDEYIRLQSQFDRQARLGLPSEAMEVTTDVFLSYLSAQVMSWDATEIAALEKIIAHLKTLFEGIQLSLPDEIFLIKTTGREEGAAAYTRHDNVIVLPVNMVSSILDLPPGGDPLHPAPSTSYLTGILTHEFFHIFSKNNPEWRRKLYQLVGFQMLDQDIELPDINWVGGNKMPNLKITNPDAPRLNVVIEMKPPDAVNGTDVPMLPVLISSSSYRGGSFFETLEWIFMEVEKSTNGQWSWVSIEGKPVTYPSDLLLKQYKSIVGYNFDQEIFHPEEVLAQSFVLTANQPSLGLLKNIQNEIWGSDEN